MGGILWLSAGWVDTIAHWGETEEEGRQREYEMAHPSKGDLVIIGLIPVVTVAGTVWVLETLM